MRLVVFPLQTLRTDARRGVIARRLAEEVAERIADASYVEWVLTRGDRAAHVVVETPLPLDVVRGELAAAHGTDALVGSLDVTPLRVAVNARLVGPDTDDALPSVEAPSLALAADALARAVADRLGVDVAPRPTEDDTRRFARWCDRDNDVLVARSGVGALAEPEDAFRHLIPLSDDETVRQTLRARRDAWAVEGAGHLAVRSAEAIAAATGADEDFLAWATVAESNDDAGEQEQALAAWSRTAERPGRARVMLGKLLISLRRAREAMPLLQEAIEDADCRDAAETYLGMACAAVGDIGRAVEHWRRVADEGKDTAFVRMAREQLQRATSLRGLS